MAFSLLTASEDEEIFRDDYVFNLTDFTLLGFDIKDNKVSFYYFLMAKLEANEEPRALVVSTAYSIGDEKDTKYLKANGRLDIRNSKDENANNVSHFIDEQIESGKMLYSDFIAIEETELHNMIVEVIGNNKEKGVTFSAKLEMPLSVYTRISILKAEFVNHLPLNAYIDVDARFNDLELFDNSVIEYYGADYNKLSDGILAFYTVKSSDSKIAIISAIPDPRDKVIVNPSIDVEQIKSMYGKEAYMIDMRNVFLFETKSDDGVESKVCLIIRNENNTRLYRLTCGYDDCALFHPYDYV